MKALISSSVAELQGLYGPLRILEARIQELWALQAVQAGDWRCRDGRQLRISHPGELNRAHGPDFRNAVIYLDEERLVGDIEVHLYREDWWRHGHHMDKAYNNVVLHVVLFAGGMERQVRTVRGACPAEWVLGPWLRQDLEGLGAGGEAGMFGELVPELNEWAAASAADDIREALLRGADRRFQSKEAMAAALLRTHDFADAAHHMLLYYLGYPSNRRAFFELAGLYPLEDWRSPDLPDCIHGESPIAIRWRVGRPANHAGPRLRQYAAMCRKSKDWPQRLLAMTAAHAHENQPVFNPENAMQWRKGELHCRLRQGWYKQILGGELPPGTAARLWVDVAVPLLAAVGQLDAATAFIEWFHADAGVLPDGIRKLLRKIALQQHAMLVCTNGWSQGLLAIEDQLRLQRLQRGT